MEARESVLLKLLSGFEFNCHKVLNQALPTHHEKLQAKMKHVESMLGVFKSQDKQWLNTNHRYDLLLIFLKLKTTSIPGEYERETLGNILKLNPRNLLAATLQVAMTLRLEGRLAAEKKVEELEDFKRNSPHEYKVEENKAKATLGYHLMNLGIADLGLSVKLFCQIEEIGTIIERDEDVVDEELHYYLEMRTSSSGPHREHVAERMSQLDINTMEPDVLVIWCSNLSDICNRLLRSNKRKSTEDGAYPAELLLKMVKACSVFVFKHHDLCPFVQGRQWVTLALALQSYRNLHQCQIESHRKPMLKEFNIDVLIQLAYELTPGDIYVLERYGRHLCQTGYPNYERAIHIFQEITSLNDTRHFAWHQMGKVYLIMRDLQPVKGTKKEQESQSPKHMFPRAILHKPPEQERTPFCTCDKAHGKPRYNKINYMQLLRGTFYRVRACENKTLLQGALRCFLKASELQGGTIRYNLDIALTYAALKGVNRAKEYFRMASLLLEECPQANDRDRERVHLSWAIFELEAICRCHDIQYPMTPDQKMEVICRETAEKELDVSTVKFHLKEAFHSAILLSIHSASFYWLRDMLFYEAEVCTARGQLEKRAAIHLELRNLEEKVGNLENAKYHLETACAIDPESSELDQNIWKLSEIRYEIGEYMKSLQEILYLLQKHSQKKLDVFKNGENLRMAISRCIILAQELTKDARYNSGHFSLAHICKCLLHALLQIPVTGDLFHYHVLLLSSSMKASEEYRRVLEDECRLHIFQAPYSEEEEPPGLTLGEDIMEGIFDRIDKSMMVLVFLEGMENSLPMEAIVKPMLSNRDYRRKLAFVTPRLELIPRNAQNIPHVIHKSKEVGLDLLQSLFMSLVKDED